MLPVFLNLSNPSAQEGGEERKGWGQGLGLTPEMLHLTEGHPSACDSSLSRRDSHEKS